MCALLTGVACGAATRGDLRALEVGARAFDGPDVRPPAVAGSFYPADPSALRKAIDGFLSDARAPVTEWPIAIVAPHAGYVFSGQIAADAFAQVRGRTYDVVVVLGANHTGRGSGGNAVHPGTGFRTPLGTVPLDRDVVSSLLAADSDLRAEATPHEGEHSIEVLVPFVQVLFPEARLVPIVVGSPDPRVCARLGRALAALLRGRRALVVASSDLSHYPNARDATRTDRQTLAAIASLDPEALVAHARSIQSDPPPNLVTAACGLLPVLAAIRAAREMGATSGFEVSYANSASVAVGDPERVVGYGAVVFQAGSARPQGRPSTAGSVARGAEEATAGDEQALLGLARTSISRYLESNTLPLPRDLDPALAERRQGAFVTLARRGQLRGCIGRITSDVPLPQLVSRVAVEAAVRDPRFPPVKIEELQGLDLEISLLSSPRPVDGPGDIVVGRDGVLLQKGGHSAVLLPQVVRDEGWTRPQLLDHLCAKAGLPEGCWTQGAMLATFQAQVFSDRRTR